jgi:putative ABC transport system substrate-binding protein
MTAGWEPVRLGLITSFVRPGGNVTEVAWFNVVHKQMELLKEIVPNLRLVLMEKFANGTREKTAGEVFSSYR